MMTGEHAYGSMTDLELCQTTINLGDVSKIKQDKLTTEMFQLICRLLRCQYDEDILAHPAFWIGSYKADFLSAAYSLSITKKDFATFNKRAEQTLPLHWSDELSNGLLKQYKDHQSNQQKQHENNDHDQTTGFVVEEVQDVTRGFSGRIILGNQKAYHVLATASQASPLTIANFIAAGYAMFQ
ncbi:unnamed protein product [Trifolium pratense]|uniref:Uncharacterized protein n=1 Tax=Trifolium pratense TaxID=57577 RepID=A0ACB0ME67_TRIPR|nr:unnamed protein product [Trifolium pratense]